jgi:DNA polymerase IV
MRSIIHFYMPSFHAAVEQLRKPELAGRPVIVTHRSGGGEFVISASTEAKAEGVREGMTARHAGRYCPSGMFVPADWGVYKDTSDRVLDILSRYSPLLEPHWLDRAYMDVTGCSTHVECGGSTPLSLPMTDHPLACQARSVVKDKAVSRPPHSIVVEAQHIIRKETGLVVSAGIAGNKLVAQAAASACKAGEYMTVAPGTEREFLAPLPVNHLPGVGPKIEKRLLALGVATIGELAAIPCPMLVRQFGAIGSRLHRLAQGIDLTPVQALYPPETIITEHTFDDAPSEPEAVHEHLLIISDQAAARLRDLSQKAGAVSVRLELDGGDIRLRSYVPKSPISSVQEIYSAARRIVRQEMHGARVVSVRLTLSDLRTAGGFQLNFLEDTERKIRLQALLARIHERYGERALVYGAALVA